VRSPISASGRRRTPPEALAAIEAGLAELSRDETIALEDLRSELAERRRTR
jgi:hypothetical protein